MKKQVLLYFVRYPEPGKVKTRLAQSIGFEKAAEVYKQLAEENFSNLNSSTDGSVVVTFDPPTVQVQMEQWLPRAGGYLPQKGNGLGERLAAAFDWAFHQGAKKVLAVGSDTLALTRQPIQDAFEVLNSSDVVIGPSQDGGYYLIGLKELRPAIFKDINWSTDQVRSQTLERIASSQLSYQLIEMLEDLDDAMQLSKRESVE